MARGGAPRGSRTFSGAFGMEGGLKACVLPERAQAFATRPQGSLADVLEHFEGFKTLQGGHEWAKDGRAVRTRGR